MNQSIYNDYEDLHTEERGELKGLKCKISQMQEINKNFTP